MCGINGITRNDRILIERMNQVTAHRGPDGSFIYEDKGVTLGHNRLSVIDVREVANQPFLSDDGRYVIVYNGELYNFKELKAELNGYTYRTVGDTEVVLNAYRKWGSAAVKRFNGMFAFAIWDTKEQTLFLARDRFGIKPLYYGFHNDAFVFSSEIKGVLEAGIPRVLHMSAFMLYMQLLYVPGKETLFEGVERLLPGTMMTYKDGVISTETYYTIPHTPLTTKSSYSELTQGILDRLDQGVTRQLISDVPLGIYLSGGIDSTAVLDSATRMHGQMETFSIGFDLGQEEESDKFNADFDLAERTAKHYGARHRGYTIQGSEVVPLLMQATRHHDMPIGNLTALAQLKLAEEAKKQVTVVLGGDGGDELFGGYKRHALAQRLLYYWKLPAVLRKFAPPRLRKANVTEWEKRYMLFLAQKDNILHRILNVNHSSPLASFYRSEYFSGTTNASFLDDMMRADLGSWLPDESLLRSDTMSMAYGLEERVPLLDNDLADFAHHIPSRYKVTLTHTKKIFKDALRTRLPEHVFNQPKRGWISPGAKWLRRTEMQSYTHEVLDATYYAETSSLFNWDELQDMYASHIEKREYHLTPLWAVIAFQIWAKEYNVTVPHAS